MTSSGKPGNTGVKRIIRAAGYSIKGLHVALRQEAAFRQELTLMLIMVPLAFWLGESTEQYLLLIGPCFLVIVVELLNSAIESTVDRISHDYHELSGKAKDMGSAAVFCSLLLVVLSWAMIGWDRFAG